MFEKESARVVSVFGRMSNSSSDTLVIVGETTHALTHTYNPVERPTHHLTQAVYTTFGFSMVAVMTEVYGVRRFLELARSRMRAHPYHIRQGKAVGPASVTMYALNDITTLGQQRLGDHYDTTASHWKSIVESLSPEVAKDIYEAKAATKRNRNTQVKTALSLSLQEQTCLSCVPLLYRQTVSVCRESSPRSQQRLQRAALTTRN